MESFIREADEKLQQRVRSLLMAEVAAAWKGRHPGCSQLCTHGSRLHTQGRD